MDEEEKVMA